MKFAGLIPLAALSTAFVIPDEAVLQELAAQTESKLAIPEHPLDDLKDTFYDAVDEARDDFESIEFGMRDSLHDAKNALDDAFARISDAEEAVYEKIHETGFDVEGWLRSGSRPHHRGPPPPHHDGPPRPHHEGPPPPPPHHEGPPPPPPHHEGPPPPWPYHEGPPPPPPPHHKGPPPPPHHEGPPPPPPHGDFPPPLPHGDFPPPPPHGDFAPPPPPHHKGDRPPPPPPHGDRPFPPFPWEDERPFPRPPSRHHREGDHPPPPPPDAPHHGPPHEPHEKPPHKGKPHHPPHHGKPNQTVYELIANSKYTTKLAKLINEYPDLVEALNGTKANYTVFAPTDKAFEKIPKHGKEPSKEFLKNLLLYHVSADFYPAGRVLTTHTIPSLYKEPCLGEDLAQRLSVSVGFKGLTLNFYSRIVAINIFGTNGVIHGIDSILIPPPKAVDIISLLPSEFSTLTLGLEKTGLLDAIKAAPHSGGTIFAPSNFAFKKLGPRLNAFLFSSYGEKYLKALLKYHVVANQTLYSDAFYDQASEAHGTEYFHFDLPTLLDDKALSVDIGKHGPFIEIKINGFSRVAIKDGIAKDGVIQVVGNVLIPPKTSSDDEHAMEEPMTVEELKDRLRPWVESEETNEDSDSESIEVGWGEL